MIPVLPWQACTAVDTLLCRPSIRVRRSGGQDAAPRRPEPLFSRASPV